jgi:hypothetical protein
MMTGKNFDEKQLSLILPIQRKRLSLPGKRRISYWSIGQLILIISDSSSFSIHRRIVKTDKKTHRSQSVKQAASLIPKRQI